VSSKQPTRGDGRDGTLSASQRPEASGARTEEIPRHTVSGPRWRIGQFDPERLLEAAPSGFAVIDPDGGMLYANQAFLTLVSLKEDTVVKARIQDFLSRGAAIFYETQFVPSLIIRGSLEEISFDFVKPDGTRVPTLVNAVVQTDSDTTNNRISLSIFTAKQRRLYESELLRSRRESEEISDIVRRSSDAILQVSATDVIESWNRGAEQIFGYTPDAALGKSLFSLISEDCLFMFRAIVETMKRGEEVVVETIACRCSGESVDVSVSLNPTMEAPGTLVGYSAIIRNVTDRKIAEKALLQAEKLASVGRLASSISHEINNPLESVTNLLYILGKKEFDEESNTLIQTAQEELARVSQIAIHTLRFHKQSGHRTEVELRSVFDSVLGLYRARLNNANIMAINDASGDLSLTCFEGELRQVLVNLVANSYDAMRSGGIMRLRGRRVSLPHSGHEGIRITIADTGSGISATVMDRLFEPFFSTKGIGGTGLGLWISRDLVRKNQGKIRVRSKTYGERTGTVVTLQFPRKSSLLA
jgi:PAS domain S-box-containing protein